MSAMDGPAGTGSKERAKSRLGGVVKQSCPSNPDTKHAANLTRHHDEQVANPHDVTSMIVEHRQEYINNFFDVVVVQEQFKEQFVMRHIVEEVAATRRQQVCSCSDQTEWCHCCCGIYLGAEYTMAAGYGRSYVTYIRSSKGPVAHNGIDGRAV
jgi:hypothetical protein